MSPISYTPVEELKPDQHQVNLKVKVIAQIILGEVDDYSTWNKTKVAEILIGDSTGCIIMKAINGQINILQPNAMVCIHNARVEMYRGFMRIVADQNINAEIKPIKDNWIMIDENNTFEDDEYQYVPMSY
ncbi:15982_t:CDS:2 [Funneliformis geosporum]|uniref:15982_t:CDS:1 n=1 Tax=Funneliformis geosporum TaxID=1117311 RepID=A0A9W4SRJ3_9GLOM|nr:15982_t:CDS:2 [Funneliformis geosporum]